MRRLQLVEGRTDVVAYNSESWVADVNSLEYRSQVSSERSHTNNFANSHHIQNFEFVD
jgi:hypothetical protein